MSQIHSATCKETSWVLRKTVDVPKSTITHMCCKTSFSNDIPNRPPPVFRMRFAGLNDSDVIVGGAYLIRMISRNDDVPGGWTTCIVFRFD